jgi:thiol-disulfide isomerase/thioredoxin
LAQQPPSVPGYLFYSEECASCEGILQGYLPTLKSLYPFLDVKAYDVKNPSYYSALTRLEEKFNRRGNEFPVLFIGDQMLSGSQEIMERLEPLLQDYQIRTEPPPSLPPLEAVSKAAPSEKTFSVELAYFYQKGCPKCDRAGSLLKYLAGKFPHLRIQEIDLNTPEGKRLNETLSNRIHLPPERRLIAPAVFIGNDYLAPEALTEANVEALIRKYEREEKSSPLKVEQGELQKAEKSMVERYRSLGVLTIISAGFIDGLNPCAFATLIFFVSYLTLVGRKRREILWVGVGFSGAVFVTYLLIGFGLFRFIQHLSFLPLFSRVVYFVTILFALALGTLSLYDVVQLKRGRSSEMKLQLPEFLKKRIHRTIRERSKSSRYFGAAVAAGFIISLLEFTCTGQVYLPTILFVMNIPSLKTGAFSYLILYNVFFILPLLVIFGVVYWGVTSEQLAFFLQKRVMTIKLITAILFYFLAGILIANFL